MTGSCYHEPMKTIQHIQNKATFTYLLTVAALSWALSTGCSKSPSNDTSQVTQAPQGAPIEGELIESEEVELKVAAKDLLSSLETSLATSTESTDNVSEPEIDAEQVEPLTGLSPEENAASLTEEVSTEAFETALVANEEETPATDTPNTAALIDQPLVTTDATLSGDFLSVSFDKLASFEYQMPEDLTAPVADEEGTVYKEQIPADIKALNAKNISLKGFMLPLKVEKGLVTEMLIMRDQSMCCYGTVPKINEWVSVRMEEEGVKPIMDEAVTIYGTLQVGEVLENGYLVGIYEMAGQKMDDPQAN